MGILRTSSYMIPVKLEQEEGKYMLIHGYTGAADIISESFLGKIKSIEEGHNFSESMLQTLLKRGYITTKTQDEEYAYVKRIASLLHRKNKLLTKYFTLVVSYDCNFRCPYCFEKELVKDSKKSSLRTISQYMVDKFYTGISKIEPEKKLQHKYINLFGGEPLLKENKDIIAYIIEKGRKQGFAFMATTNGYDLNHFTDYLGESYIESVQITIDGPQSVHDQRRIHYTNIGTFDKIIDNMKLALDKGIYVKVRVNIDENNINELVNLDKTFETLGLYNYKKFLCYAAFISGDVNFIPQEEDKIGTQKSRIGIQDFLNIFKQNKLRIKHDTRISTNLRNIICEGKELQLSPCHCTAQGNAFVFDPFGYTYTCLELVGDNKKAIGTYQGTKIQWYEEKEKWFERNIGNVKKCNKCKYALLCGGGCFTKTFSNSSGKQIDSSCDQFPLVFRTVVNEIYISNKRTN